MQIRSDRIRSDFGTKIYISDRIGLIKLFRKSDRIGLQYSKYNKLIIHALSQELIIHAFIKALSRLSLHYLFDTSIGRHFVSFLTCIRFYCFYINLVKYFNLNEKFILLKDSSDRIGILYQNSDRIRIRQFRIGFETLANCRIINVQSDPMHTSNTYITIYLNTLALISFNDFHRGRVRLRLRLIIQP